MTKDTDSSQKIYIYIYIPMANTHMKSSASLVVQRMKIKINKRYDFIPTRLSKIKK